MNVKIDIGGDGTQTEIDLKIVGCECRTEDFLMALVAFSNNWKLEADKVKQPESKPCGCKDAQ